MLREFASKRHVKLSRVTIRAKDDDEEEEEKVKPAATKHRRRRARGGERKESDRSLAKVRTPRRGRRPSVILISFPVSIARSRLRV